MSRACHRDAIHALLDAGISRLADICGRVGCSKNTAQIYRTEWRKLHGLGRIEHPPQRCQQVIELDAQGLSDREIAAKLGITAGAVSAHRHLAGLPPRMQQRRAKSPGATGKTWTQNKVQVPDAPHCPRCGLRGQHECLPTSATAFMGRKGEPFMGATGR